MKKLLFLLLCTLLAFSYQSCKDDKNDTSWRDENEAAFNAIASNPDYIATTTPEGPGTVYRKVLHAGTDTIRPLYTSTVKINYKGMYYDRTIFQQTPEGVSYTATVNSSFFASGLKIALQNMVVGDKWEIWVPWSLVDGSVIQQNGIPAYSTLIYQIELVEISNLF